MYPFDVPHVASCLSCLSSPLLSEKQFQMIGGLECHLRQSNRLHVKVPWVNTGGIFTVLVLAQDTDTHGLQAMEK